MLGCGDSSTAKPSQHFEADEDSGLLEDSISPMEPSEPSVEPSAEDTAEEWPIDTGEADPPCEAPVYEPYPFVSQVVSYEPGLGAGFGQDQFPEVIFGPPKGMGENAGGLDVLSLGQNGTIVVSFDTPIQNGVGVDLIVFENAFTNWVEPAIVSASIDGETWHEWPCELDEGNSQYDGCAGVTAVLSHPDNCVDARDPELAGGDAFDLEVLGLNEAVYIRIQDAGVSGPGGFDLDAVVQIQ